MNERAAWPVLAGIDFSTGRLFDTCDTDEARRLCSQAIVPHSLEIRGRERPFRFTMDRLPFGALSLCRVGWQAPVSIDPGALENDYLLCMPLRGCVQYRHGTATLTASQGQVALAGGGERFHFLTSADYDEVVVQIPRTVIDHAWTALAGDSPSSPIRFKSEVSTDGPAWRALESVLQLLVNATADDTARRDMPHLGSRVQDMLLTILLLQQPHSRLSRQPRVGRMEPSRVRHAKAFMRERLEQPLTLALVAEALQVPARTLQQSFQIAEGMGPMQWLREQRLQAARAMLLSGQDRTRVTDVALQCGFHHLGEFSQRYRLAFGEPPSATLRQRR